MSNKQTSIITRINLAMSAIIMMAISTIMVFYWLSDQADNRRLRHQQNWLHANAQLLHRART